ncbi:M20/M25/M40 family metallo-hydrolase [Caulobacter vibrioides]|uniref:Peptidase, M20/M25/M40 family n=2 Tax=Caulobacter vibrioides TaxID=155892 RepID=Q9A3G5_CAUVC|nr:M20/M25/M40 family metallo-hydrolase [Caulobacter vibrioides]YP_002518719.1 N-acyl-L-amino acid amidohydrolase [Caulobacter vibrioides NA1000]AAK25201.1 peptidase, M20/M25/M40 family [Caulobacter vibrioides CB15]ACL96811.1 N-acyl-L-amino acid amidohydrolase [Caulobacter vibrioides NA1000]ATC30065.1 peptidase M20 [Caulobacter vibrioides]QXZ51589.1 M20/M25/M40 family metallo-hydrolase [Caulobacter vibrioides]
MKPMAWMTAGALIALATAANAQTAEPPKTVRPDQLAFRDLYKELVEINTTLSVGSCTAASEAMGARLKAAGFPEADVRVVVEPKHPREGNLVAVLRGTDATTKPMLLLAHIDVVEAKREDWTRDPFKLVEENGYFYGRGTSDDKAQAAIWVDSLIRLKQAGFKPKRDIKMALTCGEESEGYNGIEDLLKNHRPLVDAEFALNEGASGLLDEQGKAVMLEVQAGEKVYQDFTLTVTNPGGHSSRPVSPNAIYQLSAALDRIGAYQFPPRFNDATRGYFTQMQARVTPEQAAAMKTLVADVNDPAALALITKDRTWNSMLRTTCVATMVSAGHAPNALPQRATANINCRILPGTPIDEVKAKLTELAADPAVAVTLAHSSKPASPPPPLTPAIMAPIQKNAAKLWPGVPILPVMSTGATDAVHTSAAGIPTYGVTGLFHGPEGTGAHGLNERMRVKSLYEGRDFLHGLIQDYAGGK